MFGEKITDNVYEKIRVYDTNIKCYANSMTLIKMDETGSITDKKTYSNYVSLAIEKQQVPSRRFENTNFSGGNKGNERSGWYRPVISKQVGDSLVETWGDLGLKDTLDSIAIYPTYKHIELKYGVGITKAYFFEKNKLSLISAKIAKERKLGIVLSPSTVGVFKGPFHLIDQEQRKRISRRKFLAVRTKDFKYHELARAYEKDLCLINDNGEIIVDKLTYYSKYSDHILAVCTIGEISLNIKENGNTVCKTSTFLTNVGTDRNITNKRERFIEINGGKWYYYNSKGEQMNNNPYDYAGNFKHQRAIVRKGNKWGVIDTAMNIIIPFEYARIDRIIKEKQSFFEVHKSVGDHYLYLSKTGKVKETNISNLTYYEQGKWFAQREGSKAWGILDTNLNLLTKYDYDRISPYENGYATVSKRGKKTIVDENTNQILPYYKARKIISLGFDRYAIKEKSGLMIVSISGDTILQGRECKSVLACNQNFLVYESRGKIKKVLNFGNKNSLPKKTELISFDLENGLFLIKKKGRKKLYSLIEKKYVSKGLDNAFAIGEGCMLYQGENRQFGYLNYQGDTLIQPIYKKLTPLKNGWAFAQKEHLIIDKTNKSLFDFPIFRVNPLGDSFTLVSKSGTGLISEDATLIIPPKYQKIERYNSIFYKAIKVNGECDLFTLNGEKLNDRSFQNIKAIHPDELIVKSNGFDYLYDGFLNQSLSFQKIQPVSRSTYLLEEKRIVGIYNTDGKIIVPVRYHKVELNKNYFQVSFFNSFGYYGIDGKIIADPK